MPLTVPLGHGQHFLLRGITLLALNVAVSRFRQHGSGSSQQPVSRVDLVQRAAGDHEERHAVADLRCPARALVESGLNDGLRGIVPDDSVTIIRHHEGDTHARSRGRSVVVPAFDAVSAMIEKPFLILAEAVIVLVIGRSKGGTNLIEGGIGRTLVIQDCRVAILVIGHGHRPVRHSQHCLAFRRLEQNADPRIGTAEELADIDLGRRGLPRMVRLDGNDHASGAVNIPCFALLL
jgi:hypothetical protein